MIIKFKKDIIKKTFDSKLKEELFGSVIDTITKDLDIKDCKILKEYSKGASLGVKRVISLGDNKFFIKIGEKVAKENEVYNNVFFKNNNIFLKKIDKYCIHLDVLVLPFYEGKNLDELIFDKSISIDDKIGAIEMVLNGSLESFWCQNIKRGNDNLDWTEEYLMGRLAKLITDVDSIKVGATAVAIDDFLNYPISYLLDEKIYQLPSIKSMHEKVVSLLRQYKPQFTTCVTADFQPPNIIIGDGKFKHIDLSNGEIDGDIALDIGKFFNFINRFYRVSFLRDGLLLGDNIKPKFVINGKDIFLSMNKNQSQFNDIISQIEERFLLKVASLTGDFNIIDRVKLYKFVINSITIRRHLDYPGLGDLLFTNLIDSYVEINDKIMRI